MVKNKLTMNYRFLRMYWTIFLVSFLLNGYSQSKNPNILLIVVDDLKDYTGFLGGHPQVNIQIK